jgi:hypothetical protein
MEEATNPVLMYGFGSFLGRFCLSHADYRCFLNAQYIAMWKGCGNGTSLRILILRNKAHQSSRYADEVVALKGSFAALKNSFLDSPKMLTKKLDRIV